MSGLVRESDSSLVERFRRASQKSRQFNKDNPLDPKNRAAVHLIPSGVSDLLSSDEWYRLPENKREHDLVLNYLRAHSPNDLWRGDIIIIEEKLNDEAFDSGKFAFNGKKIINWNFNPDIPYHWFLPQEFQVISEFPLHYWRRGMNYMGNTDNILVPFDVRRQLPQIIGSESEVVDKYILTFRPGDDEECYMEAEVKIMPFQSNQGDVYYIAGQLNIYGEFDTTVPLLKYFSVTKSIYHYQVGDYQCVDDLKGENTLFIPEVNALEYVQPELSQIPKFIL